MKKLLVTLILLSFAISGMVVTFSGTASKYSDIRDEYATSGHANSNHGYNANTYCANCHSPANGDPDATHSDNDPIAPEDWENIGCMDCHGKLRGEDALTPDELCTSCHSGSRHAPDFQGYGDVMHNKKGVQCIDCHMPPTPTGTGGEHKSHAFEAPDGPESCGIGNENCHENKDDDWGQKQLDKGIHDKGSYGQIKKE
jgi:formate-dependent nitrite reductase cytochrome c552 subunit